MIHIYIYMYMYIYIYIYAGPEGAGEEQQEARKGSPMEWAPPSPTPEID